MGTEFWTELLKSEDRRTKEQAFEVRRAGRPRSKMRKARKGVPGCVCACVRIESRH